MKLYPSDFTNEMRQVDVKLRRRSLRIMAYMDNFALNAGDAP